MEANRFNVLWLDDDFQPPIENPDNEQEKINQTRMTLREDADLAADYNLVVECIYDKNVFYQKIKMYHQYQAVIFDLKGLDLNDSTEDSPMPEAYEEVKKLPLATYVYSGNPEDPVFKITLMDLKKRGRVFGKLKDGPEKLFEKIYDDLSNSFNIYCGHKECLALFNEFILQGIETKANMDNILSSYSKKGELSPTIYNSIRKILEAMMDCLVDKGLIGTQMDTLNKKIDYLTDYYGKTTIKGKLVNDYNNPLVPYSICPMEIKYTISFLGKMANYYSHFIDNHPRYMRENETTIEYNKIVQDAVYSAFFVTVKWFYAIMTNH